jgi:hypothetical protein
MTDQAKKSKITRENKIARVALEAGACPADLPQSAFVRGWDLAYTHAPDEPRKAGWWARFEAGAAARLAHDARA